MSDALPQELRLSLDWELWVVEHLLFDAKLEDLVERIAAQGIEASLVRARVLEIMRCKGFERLRERLGQARLAARLMRLEQELRGAPEPVEVPVRETIDRATLREQHWIPSRPVKLTDVARTIPAVREWSLQSLAQRFGSLPIEVNVRRLDARRTADTERYCTRWTLAEFAERSESEASNDFYVVSRNGLLSRPELASLWDELVDLPSFLMPLTPPRGVSLWVGPAGTVTPPHFDPHNVLLVQVQGRKRIRLAARPTPALATELDGYYLARPLDEVFAGRADAVASVTLGPKEALFVPAGWFHEVTALDPSMTLSFLNFPWPNHFHWLGPPGSDDRERA